MSCHVACDQNTRAEMAETGNRLLRGWHQRGSAFVKSEGKPWGLTEYVSTAKSGLTLSGVAKVPTIWNVPSFTFMEEASGAADFASSSSSSSSAISSSEAPATQLARNCKRAEVSSAKQSFAARGTSQQGGAHL